MGTCESLFNDNKTKNETKRLSNQGKQLYCAPVNDYLCNNNNSKNLGTTINTKSQLDIMSLNEFNKKNNRLYTSIMAHIIKKMNRQVLWLYLCMK